MKAFVTLSLLASLLGCVYATPINLFTMRNVTKQWLEIGFMDINSGGWRTATTRFDNFTDPIVLISLPPVAGATSSDGYPSSIRLQNIQRIAGGYFSFDVKVYLTDDVCCNATWYTPQPTGNLMVSWAVVEKGAISLEGYYFFAFTGSVARNNMNLVAGSPDFIDVMYPVGCNDTAAGAGHACKYPVAVPTTSIAAVAQIQSLNSDRYLLSRAQAINRQKIVLLLEPHDATDPSYYVIPAETVGVLTFEKNVAIACVEKLSFETALFDVTSHPITYNYTFNNYVYSPGTYGSLITMASLVDSTHLRVFEHTTVSTRVITQEDKCVDEETEHQTGETMGLLVVGEQSVASDTICMVYYNSPDVVNCSTFYLYDLFGDGWGEGIKFQVTTHGDFVPNGTSYSSSADTSFTSVQYFSVDCQCYEFTVCSQSAEFNVSVVNYTEPVRFPWEIYWEYEDVHGQLWIGDIDTTMGIDNNVVVWYNDLVEYNVNDHNCTTCPPKPKPKPTPSSPAPQKGPAVSVPPPPAFIDFTLMDSDNDGWFETGGWSEPCDLRYPDVLVYPRYFITNAEGDELIHEGSLCEIESEKICHEHMPHDGKFIFRVAGFVKDGSISWDFCGVQGGIAEEVEFEMDHGKCKALQTFTANELCTGILSVAVLKGELMLKGVTTDALSEFDTWALEEMLKVNFNAPVTVNSWVLGSTGSLVVSFSVTITMEERGYDGTFFDMQEAFYDDMSSSFATAVEKGFLAEVLDKEIQSSTVAAGDALRNLKGIELMSFTFSSITFSSGQAVDASEPVAEEVAVTKESGSLAFNLEMGAAVFVGVVMAGFLAVIAIVRFGKRTYQQLSDRSEHL